MKTILVAEDEFDLLNSIRTILQSEGYEVLTCANGQDALKLAKERRPDLLITDVTMPHLSGIDVIKKIRSDGTIKEMKTIIMSGIRAREEIAQLNAGQYLQKPFSIDQLMGAVRSEIDGAEGSGAV